jgi:hypothetical protein
MSFTRTCDGQRQPCPHPFLCNPDCQFNCATRLETGNSDCSNPDEPQSKGGRLFIWAVGLVAACLAIVHLVPK